MQASRQILGYGLDRKPDLSHILRDDQDLDMFLRESWMEGMHWLLMLSFVEVKHENGKTLSGHGIRKRTKEGRRKQVRGNNGSSSTKTQKSSGGLPAPTPENTSLLPGFEGASTAPVTSDPEDKASALFRRTRQRAAAYGRALFSAGAIRSHVIALVIDARFKLRSSNRNSERSPEDREEQELQSKKPKIDRKGKEKERVDSQGSLTHASTESFVFSNIQSQPSEYTSAEATASPVIAEYPSLVGYTYTLVVEGVKRVLRVTQVIFRSGRGTNVLEVQCIEEEEVAETAQRTALAPKESWKGGHLILKLSFPLSKRTKESMLIDTARAHAETHNAKWALRHLPRVVASVDSLNWEGNDPNQNTLQKRLKSHFGDAYEMRSLRATVLEKLEPLSNLKSAREFAQVFYDILQIHRWLYEQPKILHRDLSMANIMFRREGDQVYGVLNDFDLSSLLTRMDKSPTLKHRTGTKPFMAHNLLNTEWDKGHLYRHDLESLFYIILIVSCHYSGPTTRAYSLPYKAWFDGVDQVISASKIEFLQSESMELPVQTYYNGFTQWLIKIRQMLNQGYKSRPGPFFWSDKDRLKAALYDWETLDGNVTYLKMMEVMYFFDGEELVTRWDGGGKSS
ncbi:hypothetical protein D9757_009422 [Collybiopsis confluens]|uniref:Protein kinase domain-containing protein n=1 Tax=Collybiopsis confluens TaxID=2823264 RepID=A0A8H5HD93_9AGAR|nr:hypothetical protein D9757_009422 [Collybiopsis confluens]